MIRKKNRQSSRWNTMLYNCEPVIRSPIPNSRVDTNISRYSSQNDIDNSSSAQDQVQVGPNKTAFSRFICLKEVNDTRPDNTSEKETKAKDQTKKPTIIKHRSLPITTSPGNGASSGMISHPGSPFTRIRPQGPTLPMAAPI